MFFCMFLNSSSHSSLRDGVFFLFQFTAVSSASRRASGPYYVLNNCLMTIK